MHHQCWIHFIKSCSLKCFNVTGASSSYQLALGAVNEHVWVRQMAPLLHHCHEILPSPPCHLQPIISLWSISHQNVRRLITRRTRATQQHVQQAGGGTLAPFLHHVWNIHIRQWTTTALFNCIRRSLRVHQTSAGGASTIRLPRCITSPDRRHLSLGRVRVLCCSFPCAPRLRRLVSQPWLKCQWGVFAHAVSAVRDACGRQTPPPPSPGWSSSCNWGRKLRAYLKYEIGHNHTAMLELQWQHLNRKPSLPMTWELPCPGRDCPWRSLWGWGLLWLQAHSALWRHTATVPRTAEEVSPSSLYGALMEFIVENLVDGT